MKKLLTNHHFIIRVVVALFIVLLISIRICNWNKYENKENEAQLCSTATTKYVFDVELGLITKALRQPKAVYMVHTAQHTTKNIATESLQESTEPDHTYQTDISHPVLLTWDGYWIDQNGVTLSHDYSCGYFANHEDYAASAISVNRQFDDLHSDYANDSLDAIAKSNHGQILDTDEEFITQSIEELKATGFYVLKGMYPGKTETVDAYLELKGLEPTLIPIFSSSGSWLDQYGNPMDKNTAKTFLDEHSNYQEGLNKLLHMIRITKFDTEEAFAEAQEDYCYWFIKKACSDNNIIDEIEISYMPTYVPSPLIMDEESTSLEDSDMPETSADEIDIYDNLAERFVSTSEYLQYSFEWDLHDTARTIVGKSSCKACQEEYISRSDTVRVSGTEFSFAQMGEPIDITYNIDIDGVYRCGKGHELGYIVYDEEYLRAPSNDSYQAEHRFVPSGEYHEALQNKYDELCKQFRTENGLDD